MGKLDTDIKVRRMRKSVSRIRKHYPHQLTTLRKLSAVTMLLAMVLLPALTVYAWLVVILAN